MIKRGSGRPSAEEAWSRELNEPKIHSKAAPYLRFREWYQSWYDKVCLQKQIKLSHQNVFSCGLPQWLSGKESTCNAGAVGDVGLNPGLGRSPGGGHGNPLQYSCLGNPIDRGAWWATVHGVAKSRT